MNSIARRTLLLAAAIVPLAASISSAQYRVDNGSARDANNRLGSGGYNDGRNDGMSNDKRLNGLAGNYLITGNVGGGRSFRGPVGYTDASAFRGQLGSADFDPFVRDSVGISGLRGAYGVTPGNTPTPFFGGRTVTAPPGFVRSNALDNGSYVQRTTPPVLANDGRVDYGGASRGQVTQSLIDANRRYGNGSAAPTTDGQFGTDPTGGYVGSNSPMQLSEFTTLAKQRRDLFGADQNTAMDNRIQTDTIKTPSNPFDTTRQPTVATDPNATPVNDVRSISAMPIDARPTPDANAQPGDTGEGLSSRTGKGSVLDNNAQYKMLRDRLEQARGISQKPTDPNQAIGGPINAQAVGGGVGVATGQGRITTPTAGTDTDKKDDTATPAANSNDKTDAAQPAKPGDAPVKPGDQSAAPRATGLPADTTTHDLPPKDTTGLPRPDGALGAPNKAAPTPVQIQSLAVGVKDAKLVKVLTQAEEQMRAGKFGSAIDTYEHAEEIAADDPLVFMGRSIAELGGGYFRNSEVHLRQAFDADQSLLYAKFDLRAMLGDDRLNQLATKLGDVANQNPNDPGPMMLLAFIYYNGGMEDRAARALDMAQVRANGKDKEVEQLRKTWSLDAPAMNK